MGKGAKNITSTIHKEEIMEGGQRVKEDKPYHRELEALNGNVSCSSYLAAK